MPPGNMSPDELEAVIERAITRAFIRIGVASTDDKEAIEIQRDFSYLRDLRIGATAIKNKGVLAVVGIVITGITTLIWFGLQYFFNHPIPPGHP